MERKRTQKQPKQNINNMNRVEGKIVLTPEEANKFNQLNQMRATQEKYVSHLIQEKNIFLKGKTQLVDTINICKEYPEDISEVTLNKEATMVTFNNSKAAMKKMQELADLCEFRLKAYKQKITMAEEHIKKIDNQMKEILKNKGMIFDGKKSG